MRPLQSQVTARATSSKGGHASAKQGLAATHAFGGMHLLLQAVLQRPQASEAARPSQPCAVAALLCLPPSARVQQQQWDWERVPDLGGWQALPARASLQQGASSPQLEPTHSMLAPADQLSVSGD